jgi:hypothetical protein
MASTNSGRPSNRTTRVAAVVAVVVLLLASCAAPSRSPTSASPSKTSRPPAAAGPSVLTPLVGSVIAEPVPFRASDGKDHLAYELKLTNALGQEIKLTSVSVVSGDKTLLSLSGDKLTYWTRALGTPAVPTAVLGPGQSDVVWFDVALERPADGSPAPMPTTLSHAVGIAATAPSPPLVPPTMTETIAAVAVSDRKPVEIAPPLSGPDWFAGDGCCDMGAHRVSVIPIDGELYVAERFAIDYVQLTPDGKLFNGDKSRLDSYAYYGAPIHAVANGPVVAVVDGLPEQTPGGLPTGLPLAQYGGNHVVQDIGGGNYAFYAHLKSGSVKVKPGDQLTTGQTIAALGNSGNSNAPHLHFHVMNTPDPLRSNGLPFLFKSFRLDSRVASMQALDPLQSGQPAQLQPGFAARGETDASPLVLDVMTY